MSSANNNNTSTTAAGSSAGPGGHYGSSSSSSSIYNNSTPPLWEMNEKELNTWFNSQSCPLTKLAASSSSNIMNGGGDNKQQTQKSSPDDVASVAWKNVLQSLKALTETNAADAAPKIIAAKAKQQQQQAAAAAAASQQQQQQQTAEQQEPPRKKAKTARSSSERSAVVGSNSSGVGDNNDAGSSKRQHRHVLHDPYRIWLHVPSKPYSTFDPSFRLLGNEEDNNNKDDHYDYDVADHHQNNGDQKKKGNKKKVVDDDDDFVDDIIPATLGGKLAQLSVDGLLNAMAGVLGGVVDTVTTTTSATTTTSSATQEASTVLAQQEWRPLATTWHRSLQFTIRQDILRTTPRRIKAMLAADLTQVEFNSIRKRVYDTVILGKNKSAYSNNNTNNNGNGGGGDDNPYDSDSDDDEYDEAAAAASANGMTMSDDTDVGAGAGGTDGKKKKAVTTGKAASAGRNNATLHEIEKLKKCKTCENMDQSLFVLDRKNGDVICSVCGTVVSESIMHEGSQYRKFEGEVDRNHHGDAANPLYSNAHNMSTTLSGVQMTSGAGQGGWRSQQAGGGGKNYETILRNAHAYTELNVSQFGKTDRRTRIGYKDKQKREAFINMAHTGDALNLHEAVVQRAKELFAGFRDDRELVQQFKGVIAACLCEAFEQLSAQGQAILLKQQQQAGNDAAGNSGTTAMDMDDAIAAAAGERKKSSAAAAEQQKAANSKKNKNNNGDPALGLIVTSLSARAARRNELHNATLAGRGGLLLNAAASSSGNTNGGKTTATTAAAPAAAAATNGGGGGVVDKPAPTWDLEDCRLWLLDASRKIAQQWVQLRQAQIISDDKKPSSTTSAAAVTGGGSTAQNASTTGSTGAIPSGTLEELEGGLVEHSFTLCEHLEAELAKAASKKAAGRVVTPRVNNMAMLGIKWQHSHERGSGGKGGVGGSGKAVGKPGTKTGAAALKRPNGNAAGTTGGGKTAGQILILLTAKKLGTILKDNVAGEAIHKELRSVVGKQEARKIKERREEASRQRKQQMQRKPWLQARAQLES